MASFVVPAIALFLGGVVAGVMIIVAVAVRGEDRGNSLPDKAPGRLASSARRLNGVGCRNLDPDFFRPARDLTGSR